MLKMWVGVGELQYRENVPLDENGDTRMCVDAGETGII